MITYMYFGPNADTRYETEVSERDAFLAIGANTVAGFAPFVVTHDAAGRPLKDRAGEPLTVVALIGVFGIIAALAFVGSRAGGAR